MTRQTRSSRHAHPFRLGLLCAIVALAAWSSVTRGLRASESEFSLSDGNINPAHSKLQLQNTTPRARFYESSPGGLTKRVYGTTLATGATPEAAAAEFCRLHVGVFGVAEADLDARGPLHDGRHAQPLMYDKATGTYKFTMVYYTQRRGGVPVFGSDLRLLVRNEPTHPVVWVGSSLRQLDDFQVPARKIQASLKDNAKNNARRLHGNIQTFGPATDVIWAGYNDEIVAPRMAVQFFGYERPIKPVNPREAFQSYMFVADANTGEILFEQPQLVDVDFTGTVTGLANNGPGAEQCEPEEATPMPYADVTVGGLGILTDIDGMYSRDVPGPLVQVESFIRGQWFSVIDWPTNQEPDSLSNTFSVPGPGNFLHNASNTEFGRAHVNGYIHSNVVRDFVIEHNPAYPTLNNVDFPVWVNRTDGFCPGNAWYDPGEQSINFCQVGGGSPNTAWTSVIYHEYGHHLVNAGGSGQGMYGEGTGDVMSILILDVSELGIGFFGSCALNDALRDADNNLQYPCSGSSHTCGQLISGCVWDTRTELAITNPANYIDILGNIAVNSILMHNGTNIDPSITIDYLTLDDDDGNIDNGTPHHVEICTGFGQHSMDCPPLDLIGFSFPNGLPELVAPGQQTTIPVNVVAVSGTPQSGSGMVSYRYGGAGGFTTVAMNELSPNEYEAVLPGGNCGDTLEYYFTASPTVGAAVTSPTNAPAGVHSALAAIELINVLTLDFEVSGGWSGSNGAGLTDGGWNRGIPVNCNRGDPPTDFDGSGQAWLTDNSTANGCNSDVDGGVTTLTSAAVDMAGMTEPVVTYARWYSNTEGDSAMADIFEVEVSNGGSWVDVETVGPTGSEVSGGWIEKSFKVSDFVVPNGTVSVRFMASDLGAGSIVEAAVDAFRVDDIGCEPCVNPCDDGNPCTLGDTCVDSFTCAGTPVDCSAFSDQCNVSSCDTGGSLGNCDLLTPVSNGTSCDDGNACNVGETCQAGACSGGNNPDCSGASTQCATASCDAGGAEGNCDTITNVANGTTCDDGDPCNVGEACQTGSCSGGDAPDCGDAGDCVAASCDAGGTDGNCDTTTAVNQGLACNGGSGTCDLGTCVETRVFMSSDGLQDSAPQIGPTSVVIGQGTNALITVWLDDDSAVGDHFNAYQLVIDDTAIPHPGATGTVVYNDVPVAPGGGDSIFIDTGRPDWIFADAAAALPPTYNETPAAGIFGVFYATIPGTFTDPAAQDGPRYLAQFRVTASPDALGDFDLTFHITGAPPFASTFDEVGQEFVTHLFQPVTITVAELSCETIQDCADLDANDIRDDNCMFWDCISGNCVQTDIVFADMGGQFGTCPPDGTADGNDRFHALNCFENLDPNTGLGGYPCEFSPPTAFNVDAGGQFGSCNPDGVCDGNDAFAALNAFGNQTSCSCPLDGGPAPTVHPIVVDRTTLSLKATRAQVRPGDLVKVRVYADTAIADLRGYQLHLAPSGGKRGGLELVDINVEALKSHVFAAADAWDAFNVKIGQMVVGLDTPGQRTNAAGYLATYTYRVSEDAAGQFVIDVLHDDTLTDERTFLFASPANGKIAIDRVTPAVIEIAERDARQAGK